MSANFTQTQYQATADKYAAQYGIPKEIFSGLIEQESSWNPAAVGKAGEVGLTQLMPGTAADLKVNPWVVDQALEGGARYLAQQFKKFGDWTKALTAYNAGAGNVGKGNAAEAAGTQYAAKVLDNAKALGYTLDNKATATEGGGIVEKLMGMATDMMGIFSGQPGQMMLGASNLAATASADVVEAKNEIETFVKSSLWYIVGGAAALLFLTVGVMALTNRK